MLTIYDTSKTGLIRRTGDQTLRLETVWIDLLEPTAEEDKAMEAALGIDIPTRAEMREIEPSNRLYQENGAAYMTTFVVYNIDQARPDTGAFTLILTDTRLVTVRYHEPRSLPQFVARAEKGAVACHSPAAVAIGLVESIIHREADLIERVQDEVDRLAQQIFGARAHDKTRQKRLDLVLGSLGRQGDLTSRVEEAAFSMERMLTFFRTIARQRGEDKETLARISDAYRDILTLKEHAQFLSQRASFLLDATLGMINIEQNQIIKLFSVVAVMLMPPTLVASIYGMNFRHMPELDWPLGYPLALLVMVLAAVLPYLFFRRKGWL